MTIKKPSATMIMTMAITSLSLVAGTGLLFVAPIMAMMVYGFTAIFIYVASQIDNRKLWEKRAQKSIKTINDNHNKLSRTVSGHSKDIDALQIGFIDVHKTMTHLMDDHKSIKLEMLKNRAPISNAKPEFELETEDTAQSAPASISEPKAKKSSALNFSSGRPLSRSQRIKSKMKQRRNAKQSIETPLKTAFEPPANDKPAEEKSAPTLSPTATKDIARDALSKGDVTLQIQPIVNLKSRAVRSYDVFGALNTDAGTPLRTSKFITMAKQEKLMSVMDTHVLQHCLALLKDPSSPLAKSPMFFINLDVYSLTDTSYMQTLLGALAKDRTLARRFIFEIPQELFDKAVQGKLPSLVKIMRGLRSLGCRFSLDQITHIQFDAQALKHHRIQFVKMDAANFVKALKTSKAKETVVGVLRRLERNNINIIAQKIETADMLDSALRFGIIHGQGFYIAKPQKITPSKTAISTQAA